MAKFIIRGGKRLHGEVIVGGSKNAALPILAATLLTDEACVIKNVPDIRDTRTMLAILESLGSEVEFKNNTVRIQTKKISPKNISNNLAGRMRASVLLFGPLLARMGQARLPYPGGCVLGARPIDTHVRIFKEFGIRLMPGPADHIALRGFPKACHLVMPEMSVTATENALMTASLTNGKTAIHLAAIEPHVQDLCHFIQKMGGKIEGIGTHTVIIDGVKKLHGAAYTITPDYLEAGTLILASVLTRGNVTVHNIRSHDLDPFWNLLREMKVDFELRNDSVKITPSRGWKACERLQTNVFPGFPTDLQPPFTILLTQAKGESYIHEALFEGRFAYVQELKKMGALIKVSNPHEAFVTGPTVLKSSVIKSCDIRAGAAMILAALIAKGKTVVEDIEYIDRGYERFDEKLRELGADIVRVEEEKIAFSDKTNSTRPSRSVRQTGMPKNFSLSIIEA